MDNGTTPVREPKTSYAWVRTLVTGIVLALAALIIFIAGCKMSLSSFEKTYGNALVPRKNVELTIEDVKDALNSEMAESEKLEYIKDSIETLEAEIGEAK